ncbi:MAG: rod-binding protein [Pseudomonadota bacterium]
MSDAIMPLRGAPLDTTTSAQAPNAHTPSAHLREIAQQFESMFLTEMMGPMFEGLDTDGLGGGGMGEEMFRPMLIEQYASAISHSGGIGLADSLVRELAKLQTANTTAPTEDANGPGG